MTDNISTNLLKKASLVNFVIKSVHLGVINSKSLSI